MRSTLVKTAMAVLVAIPLAACDDLTEPSVPGVSAESIRFAKDKPENFDGMWDGTLTISPRTWTWELEQDGRNLSGGVGEAPNFSGVISGQAKKKKIDVLIEFFNPNTGALSASIEGKLKLSEDGNTFSGKMVQTLAFNGQQVEFSTVMTRRSDGSLALTSIQATAAGSGETSDWKWNVDGTPVD